MSKSRQHWQEDSSDYTFNQYTFYLIVLGLILAAMVYFFYDEIVGDPVPKTHFVSIVSQHGSDLPVLPYHSEDYAAIEKLVDNSIQYTFNDIISFDDEIKKLKKRSEDFQEIDTVMIWLSAVGSVDNGEPVILGSELASKNVPIDRLLSSLEELNAENIVLMLDCNHKCANVKAYSDKSIAEDISLFPDLIAEKLENHSGKVKVLLYGLKGEKPIHSFVRRRSLFGFAIEKALFDREEPAWDASGFMGELDALCRNFADQSAPQLRWFGDDPIETKFRLPKLNKPEEPEEPEEPKPFAVDKVAEKAIDQTNRTWKVFERVQSDFTKKLGPLNKTLKLSPITINAEKWSSLNLNMVELSATSLRSADEVIEECTKITAALNDFKDDSFDRIESIIENLDLIEEEVEFELTESELDQRDDERAKRRVAVQFQEIHEMHYRIQHYVAVADSLIWILPGNTPVYDRYCELLIDAVKAADIQNEIWSSEQPSLDRASEITELHKSISKRESILKQRLVAIARGIVPQLKGFQQEMVVEALLRLPFLPVESPSLGDGETEDEDSFPSREKLVKIIVASEKSNSDPNKRYSSGDRENASRIRIGFYRNKDSLFGNPDEQNDSSRGLQVFAYRMPTKRFDFERFTVLDRTANPIVKVTKLAELERDGVFIERDATPIDLGLTVENVAVNLECAIHQAPDENGKPYFGFPGTQEATFTFDGNEKPKLVAYRNSIGMDPTFSCVMAIKIVDKNDPTRLLHDPISIPIKLPSQNQIEIIVDFGKESTTFRKDSETEPVRPFANRELICNFGIRNQWHQVRNGKIFLYACASPSTPTITGKINEEVREQTLDQLLKDQLTMIAESTFSLPGSGNEISEPTLVKWTLPKEVEEALPVNTDHGFLVVIDNDDVDEDWHYWVPVFPREQPVVEVNPVIAADNLMIKVKRSSFFPRKLGTNIRWYFSDFRDLGQGSLAVGKDADEFPGPKTISERCSGAGPHYLYVDVDGWPRKFVFKYNGNQFVDAPMTNDAVVDIRLGLQPGEKPPKEDPLVPLDPTSEFDRVYGTRVEAEKVMIKLLPNVPSMSAFSFADAQDHIRLFDTSNNGKLYYPRQIDTEVQLAAKSGTIILSCNVSDHEMPFEILGDRFEVGPSIKLGNKPAERLKGANRIQIQIDNKPPTIEADKCQVITSAILAGKRVAVRIKAKDEGVGIDMKSGVELFLSEPNGRLTDLTKKVPSEYRNGTFHFAAPKAGAYKIGVRLTDRVKNSEDYTLRNNLGFTVRNPKKVDSKGAPIVKKKVYKHSLTVTVSANETNLSNVTGLKVKISPEGSTPEIEGDKYTFRNLKEGVSYTVTASCKLASGFAKGRELSGQTKSRSFPKGAKSSRNTQVKLEMK